MSVLPRFIWHTQRCGRCQSSRYLYGQRDTGHIPLTYFVGSSTCLARTSPRPAHLLPRPCPEAVQDKNLRGCLERSLHAGRCSSASMCTGRRASRRLSTRGGPRCGTGAENLIRATHDPCGGKFELGAFSTPNQASSCSSCLRASSEKTKFVDKHLGGGESWRAAPRCHCSAPALSPALEYLNPTFSSSCLSVQCRCTSTTTRPLFAV